MRRAFRDVPPAIDRRQFLSAGAMLATNLLLGSRALGITRAHARLADYPFSLGVASGDPSPSGFVIWTRVAPHPLESENAPTDNLLVRWQVAEDEAMQSVVKSGEATATPGLAHSVHVEVDGLEPNRPYYFRFDCAGEASPVGRTRTFPSAESSGADRAGELRFAFASCQHFEQGLYTLYEHMAKEDLHLVAHLGDYIYEGPGRDDLPRKHLGAELATLDDYRRRHSQYKTDMHLQAAHAAFPWLVTWDDHEFDNNYAGAISEEANVATADFLARRAAAYQAYYEHMPLRRAALPQGPDMQIYRRVAFGDLAEFFVLDERQYRSDQPNGDKASPIEGGALDPAATMLGEKQEAWLQNGLSESRAVWNVLAQQVMLGRVGRSTSEARNFSMDQWPGYDAARRRLVQFLAESRVSRPVVLTGDIHSNWANEILLDANDLDSAKVAAEFVGTSISSGGDGAIGEERAAKIRDENPFVKFQNSERGYVQCTVTPQEWRSDYRVVEYVTRPGAPLVNRASFVVEGERMAIQNA